MHTVLRSRALLRSVSPRTRPPRSFARRARGPRELARAGNRENIEIGHSELGNLPCSPPVSLDVPNGRVTEVSAFSGLPMNFFRRLQRRLRSDAWASFGGQIRKFGSNLIILVVQVPNCFGKRFWVFHRQIAAVSKRNKISQLI